MKKILSLKVTHSDLLGWEAEAYLQDDEKIWWLTRTSKHSAAFAVAHIEDIFVQSPDKWHGLGCQLDRYIDDKPNYPYIDINDVASAIGIEVEHKQGEISAAGRLDIELKDGRTLRLQSGDTPDHYWVECKKDMPKG